MSYVTLYVFRENGEAEEIAEYHNNHRGAPFIWQALAEWYGVVPVTSPRTYVIFRDDTLGPLWALADDPKVKPEHRLALKMTFDWAVVPTELLDEMAKALEETARDIKYGFPDRKVIQDRYGDPGHLEDWARDLQIIAKVANGVRGVGWWMCSATEDPWWVQTNEDGDGRPYNLDQDARHHLVEAIEAPPTVP